jgi:hypothetical protein
MTFGEVERILGFDLPAAARRHPAWWEYADPTTGQHQYSRAWILAGMKAAVNLTAQRVAFERTSL